MVHLTLKRTATAVRVEDVSLVPALQGVAVKQPSTYPRQARAFFCQKCGCFVGRPEGDRFDDFICLNCWFGRVRAEQ